MQNNIWSTIRDHSLTIALSALFVACGIGAGYSGWLEQNRLLAAHHHAGVGLGAYLRSGSFIENSVGELAGGDFSDSHAGDIQRLSLPARRAPLPKPLKRDGRAGGIPLAARIGFGAIRCPWLWACCFS